MKSLFVILLGLVISGCTRHRALTHVVPLPDSISIDSPGLRYPEMVGAYHLGRTVDGEDRLHEAHTVYRIESAAQWDLHPGVSGRLLVGQPVEGRFNSVPWNDAVRAELHRQEEITRRVMEEAGRLARSTEELAGVVAIVNQVARENAIAREQARQSEERLRKLEDGLRRIEESLKPDL